MRGIPIRAAVLILMLAAACAQCWARCADAGHRVPPCHGPTQSKSPTACQVPVLLLKDTPDVGAVAKEPIAVAVVWEAQAGPAHELPPPASPPPLRSVVLRV